MKRWLPSSEAAELLAVDQRTIKRWMTHPATRGALLAVRQGKRWRIPRPADLDSWEFETRARFKYLGLVLKDSLDHDLKKMAKRCARYGLESFRLWLAALAKVLEQGAVTQEARVQIILLWHAANDILDSLPRHEMEVDKLEARFPDQLRLHGLPEKEIRAVMAYWPDERHLKPVRAARTQAALEKIRHGLDYTQAVRELKQAGEKPTEKNVRSLLHEDLTAHINDTREKLPACFIDMRQPQPGLTRHTIRKRHPVKGAAQKAIIATVYGIRDSIPGAEELPVGKKTPLRGPRDKINAPLRRRRS